MDKVSKFGYLQVNQDELNKFEKEEKLGIKQDSLIESQFIYFNSTNEGDTLVYNKLNNCLLRINSNQIFEYQLPKLYELEFSYKPSHLIMYINTKEQADNYIIFLAYIQQYDDHVKNHKSNQKLLVLRKIHLEKQIGDDYKWNEVDYIETKIHVENNQILRGVIWWEDSSNQSSSIINEQYYPSILMITNSKLILFSLKEHGIHPLWQIHENNLQFWYNMEFQSILLQTGSNILTPYINIGMNQQQKPIKLQPLELILNAEIRQQDIFLINIYQNLYCVHVDSSNKRISLRDLFNHESSDLVLDIGEDFQEFTLLVIDNVIVVINLHGKKIFGLFDIKLVKDTNKNFSKSINSNSDKDEQPETDNNVSHFYLVPTLFNDELKDNTIICLYDNNKNDMYVKSLKKIKNHHLNNYHIIVVNSSCNIIIKLDINKIQYSRLNFCIELLIENILSIEKLDILPFISNRDVFWDNVLLEKLKSLANQEMNNDNDNDSNDISAKPCPKVFTILMEIIKIKVEMKLKINQEYYNILLMLIFYTKRESLLQYVLQYHIFEDTNKTLKELYKLYLFNRNKSELPSTKIDQEGHVRFNSKVLDGNENDQGSKYFKLKNVSWLEQICMDTAYRLKNVKILIDILIHRKEYRRAIKILRDKSEQKVIININNKEVSIKMIILTLSKSNEACKYPIYNILYKLGNDIRSQQDDQNLLKDVIKEVRNWINEYFDQVRSINDLISNNRRIDSNDIVEKYHFSIIGRPNINRCNIWLPELINLKDLNGSDELMNIKYTGNNSNDDDFENDGISDSDSDLKSSLKDSNCSTFESIYISATESNEKLIVSNFDDKKNDDDSNNSRISNSISYCCNEDLTQNNNNGKFPLLHHEPGFISLSSIYINNSSESSYSSDTSSSFNSYE
ncbi:hypothetical protein CmeUKMEL1_10235 [Cryptosporidium meleagridis]|uniref:Mic1 domain-containing protein n=1 Tax=Cryptosporidium meleagridis TaxID=93969 RepID=A0A2P4Z1W2_9CRYT|nr:hypothetical protein CmeUKMEL1_10235 [Cryptosporidium meleagridis]